MSKFERIDFAELKNELMDRVHAREVHERYSGFVDRRGSMSRCPFCGNKKFYETNKNGFRCYRCHPEKINIFNYYMLKFNVGFFEAEISLARDFGFIDSEVAEKILNKTSKGNSVFVNKSVVESRPVIEDIEESVPLQSPEVISNVYDSISKLSPLKKEQYKYLRDIRNLSIDRIVADYFNMPYMYGDAGYKFMDKLLQYLSKKFGYKESDLIGIPGFYMDENNRVVFIKRKGIGMKARNASKFVNGIQIRNYDSIKEDGNLYIKNNKYKYLWVSSRDLEKGCPAGASIDVIFPNGEMHTSLFITEGKFKSEVISKRFISPVISVQGVSQWRSVLEPEIKYVDENIRKVKSIFVCYDADMGTNLRVYAEFKSMTETVLTKYSANVKMAVWDERFGKGLDDVILAGNTDKIKKIYYKDYCDKYEIFITELESRYEIRNFEVFYKGTNNKVKEESLRDLYSSLVLAPLNVEMKEC